MFNFSTNSQNNNFNAFGSTANSQSNAQSLFGQPSAQLQFGQTINSNNTGFQPNSTNGMASLQQQIPTFNSSQNNQNSVNFQQQQSQQQQPLNVADTKQQQQEQSASVIESNHLLKQFEDLQAAYNVQDFRCKFRHAFYNLVQPEDLNRYQKPQYVTDGMWQEAQAGNPDPAQLVPVFACSFDDLQKRIQVQNKQLQLFKMKLAEVQQDMVGVSGREDVELSGRLLKIKETHQRQSHKLMRVLKMVQLLRSRGFTGFTREEEQLQQALARTLQQLQSKQMLPRCSEMMERVQYLRQMDVSQLQQGDGSSAVTYSRYEVVDEEGVQQVARVINEMQKGLERVTSTLRNDLQLVDALAEGFKRKRKIAHK